MEFSKKWLLGSGIACVVLAILCAFGLPLVATSVEVLATKQEAIEENVNEIKADVKSIKALPGSRWEAVVRGIITAVIAGLIGFALARLGVGG